MQLTTRQKVEQMLEEGLTVRQIADRLKLSTQTIYEHRTRILAGRPGNHVVREPEGAEAS